MRGAAVTHRDEGQFNMYGLDERMRRIIRVCRQHQLLLMIKVTGQYFSGTNRTQPQRIRVRMRLPRLLRATARVPLAPSLRVMCPHTDLKRFHRDLL
ncbi:hypothetical protein STCU_11839 [Strigomonas culicis]|uniref:Uncharacterized protein n=1 Tax=Strigomonas culicis TaxID=28005 RepID=S9TH74_9TRYP|nr:hypothetical protein STCU_11839 [Strigomonas culicis]|eukprot:EPY15678.1 hypothetical protein STCU_11839 [Strigomonas culicis]